MKKEGIPAKGREKENAVQSEKNDRLFLGGPFLAFAGEFRFEHSESRYFWPRYRIIADVCSASINERLGEINGSPCERM